MNITEIKTATKTIHSDLKNAAVLVTRSRIILLVVFTLSLISVFDTLILNLIHKKFLSDSLSLTRNIFSIWSLGNSVFRIGWIGTRIYLLKCYLEKTSITPKNILKNWWYYFRKLLLPATVFAIIEVSILSIQITVCPPFHSSGIDICTNTNAQTILTFLFNTYNNLRILIISGFVIILTTQNITILSSISKSIQFFRKNWIIPLVWLALMLYWRLLPFYQLTSIPFFGNSILKFIAGIFALFTDAFLLISYLRIQNTKSHVNNPE